MGRFLGVFVRGILMGAADVVPGVSGGTIAYITGIYEELIESIKSFNIDAAKVLYGDGVKAFWKHINGNFLLTLGLGIVFSVLSLAKGISYVLAYYPSEISAFFFGLVIASSLYVYRQMPKSSGRLIWLVFGLMFAVGIGELRPAQIEVTPLVLFLSGAIAICAMILPGISGSFILLLLGMYQPVIVAIKSIDIVTIMIFSAGCATGLIAFVRLLSWLLHKHSARILSWLTVVLLGSLSLLWPWKQSSGLAASSVADMYNVLPWSSTIFPSSQIFLCVALSILGVGIVFVMEYVSVRQARD
ncbi:MAG: DUF368 domain-containing protein [Gammaproteobacteria bacterium]|nr:DUF368 domain-containing protein [Gammaproteobacteria bacterium]